MRIRSPHSRLALLIAFVLALALAGAACSSSSKGSASNADIVVHDFAFSPKVVQVKAGATVTVHNNGPSTHSVTSDDGTSFDISSIESGKDATFTAPTTPGTYKFHCNFHPSQMTGTLTVT